MLQLCRLISCILSYILLITPVFAASYKKIEKPPLSEKWFGIYMDGERVGFYRQKISENPEGYKMEGDGSVRMKVMGFSKESSVRESYQVAKNLAIRTFDIEQNVNGILSRISGRAADSGVRLKKESDGKVTEKQIRIKGDVYPAVALNIYPLMKDPGAGKSLKIQILDYEELKIKEVKINILGEEKNPGGQVSLKMRNNLYPFVNNDVWVDAQGNTLYESVREGLVTTRAEDSGKLGAFVGAIALAKRDLIYDFSLVRSNPPVKDPKKLTGMVLEIHGWNDSLPLLQDGGQTVEKGGDGVIVIKTGTFAQNSEAKSAESPESWLKPAEKIESDATEIVAQAKELALNKKNNLEVIAAVSSWTAEWLKDTVDDSGGAVAAYKARSGNCQSHARLYTAITRAAGIPTRFVSGLVYMEGKGFLYHSWAESMVDGRWLAVDPTYSQSPADPTHLKLLEGHLPENLMPIIAIIGKIRISVLETKY